MSARDAILGKVRRALGAGEDDDARLADITRRIANTPKGVIPTRAQLDREAQVSLFCTMARNAAATVVRVGGDQDVPNAVSTYLRSKNLAAKVRMGNDRRLKQMPWMEERSLQVRNGPSDGSDEVSVSHGSAGVAETGTVVLWSGKDNPTTLNFLPDHHIVVVEAKEIAGDLEAVMEKVRTRFGKGEMPRTLNFVTGPSRSGDIEQTLLLGAHGPRALHVIVVDG